MDKRDIIVVLTILKYLPNTPISQAMLMAEVDLVLLELIEKLELEIKKQSQDSQGL